MAITYLQEKLTGEYRNVYEKVEIYALSLGIHEAEKDEWMMNLLDSLLIAQQAGEQVEKIVGTDVEKFCEEYFSVPPKKMGERIWNEFDDIYGVARILFIIYLLDALFQIWEGSGLLQIKLDFAGILVGIAAGVLFLILDAFVLKPIRKNIIRNSRKPSSIKYAFGIVGIFALLLVISVYSVGKFNMQIPELPVIIVLGLYVVGWSFFRYRKTGKVRKEKNGFQQELKEAEKEEKYRQLQKSYIEGCRKNYERMNRKRIRKGKTAMTQTEYMELLKNNKANGKRASVIGALIVGVIYLLFIWDVSKDSTMADTLIFTGILMVAYLVFVKWMFSIQNMGDDYIAQMMKECEEKEITIFEYIDEGKESFHEK
jgi:DNA-binding ferritin-like protein (Dps family)